MAARTSKASGTTRESGVPSEDSRNKSASTSVLILLLMYVGVTTVTIAVFAYLGKIDEIGQIYEKISQVIILMVGYLFGKWK